MTCHHNPVLELEESFNSGHHFFGYCMPKMNLLKRFQIYFVALVLVFSDVGWYEQRGLTYPVFWSILGIRGTRSCNTFTVVTALRVKRASEGTFIG